MTMTHPPFLRHGLTLLALSVALAGCPAIDTQTGANPDPQPSASPTPAAAAPPP